jgi:hypothetical protein
MEDYVSDVEIARLISVEKPLPDAWEIRLKTRQRPEWAHKRANLAIETPQVSSQL